jgi:hypothetical protein
MVQNWRPVEDSEITKQFFLQIRKFVMTFRRNKENKYNTGVQGKPTKFILPEKWDFWTIKSVSVISLTWKMR